MRRQVGEALLYVAETKPDAEGDGQQTKDAALQLVIPQRKLQVQTYRAPRSI